jgi:SAM-dependent methyltransferase
MTSGIHSTEPTFALVGSCPACGASQAALLCTVSDRLHHGPGEFPVVQCTECGHIFVQRVPAPESMALYYPSDYAPYRTAIQDEPVALLRWARHRNARARRRVAERACGEGHRRLLDVGCSTGIFLDEMRTAGWDVAGIEPNPGAAEYARSRFGLTVNSNELLDAGLPAAGFDLVSFWDTLEHTLDPLATLREANHVLAPQGFVVLTLPNHDGLDRRIFGHGWNGYDAPRHLHAFTKNSLGVILSRAGFELTDRWCGLGGYFASLASLRLWISRTHPASRAACVLYKVLSAPGMRLLFAAPEWLLDRLGLGATLVVVARKTGPSTPNVPPSAA